jgi:branched-chain amino acid transport system ATP-binding protein
VSGSLVSARGLVKRFGSVIAADNISVELLPQERVGVIGANGAGKTTFVNIVTGYLKPDDGAIFFRGTDITNMAPREITRLGIRRSFQVSQLFSNLAVRDNVLVALAAATGAFPSPFLVLRTPGQIAEADKILDRLGLAGSGDLLITALPQGQRKLLDIALAMIGQSAVLLLDEPTSGISADEKYPLMDLVLTAVRAAESTVLFVEHDMEFVERYAERVIAFYDGRIIADGEPGHVFVDPDVRRYVVGGELHRRKRG